MTTIQTGGTEYDARIRRAERLSSEHTFAAEFLDFYKHVAAFQKTLRANIASSSGVKSGSAPAAELRDPLDLTVLLPHFRGFLSLIEQHAPPALGKSLRRRWVNPRIRCPCCHRIPGLQVWKPTGNMPASTTSKLERWRSSLPGRSCSRTPSLARRRRRGLPRL